MAHGRTFVVIASRHPSSTTEGMRREGREEVGGGRGAGTNEDVDSTEERAGVLAHVGRTDDRGRSERMTSERMVPPHGRAGGRRLRPGSCSPWWSRSVAFGRIVASPVASPPPRRSGVSRRQFPRQRFPSHRLRFARPGVPAVKIHDDLQSTLHVLTDRGEAG